jgi:23S rRNA (adenine2503-C2)-methyltransferase
VSVGPTDGVERRNPPGEAGHGHASPAPAAGVERLPLKDLTEPEAIERLAALGATAPEARRIWAAAVKRRGTVADLARVRQVRRTVLDAVQAVAELPRLEVVTTRTDPADGFRKYLFALPDGARVESVRIPIFDTHYLVCVSSQVGCALGCAFCATGRLGFVRNLATWEIVEQVLAIRDEADRPVRGVVFMGMGEPLLNDRRVIAAAKILSAPSGGAIDARAISISTAGWVPGIRRYTAERHPYRLVFSLTSAIPEKRGRVMPVENTHPLPELIAAIREYAAATRTRAMLAYVMIRGFNTGREDAEALRDLIGDLPVKLDLIDVNDATGRFLPPTEEELQAFRDHLQILQAPVVRRYSGGKGIDGACGMLANGG